MNSFSTILSGVAVLLAAATLSSAQQYHAPAPRNPHGVKTAPVVEPVKKAEQPMAQTLYSHGEPTDAEQYTLELINRARANPKDEGIRLMDTPDAEVQQAYSYWKINKAATKAAFAGYPARPPLAFNAKLIAAARTHSADMRDKNFQDHTGSNGSTMSSRITQAGYTGASYMGENVSAYSRSLWYGHCGFNVDWGEQNQIELGHRKNIMNFENYVFKEIGVGIYFRPPSGQQTGPYIITHDFGLRGETFLLGVVYKDNNNNNFYDPGEGLPNIKITPSKGNYYAVTSASGGYAIPVTGVSGAISITAEGTGLGQIITKNATLGGSNVKVDFTSALPGQVSLNYPPNDEQLIERDLTFTWYKTPNATAYAFDLATDDKFTKIVKTIASTKDTFVAQAGLKNGVRYYWRVKAQTNIGWGDYSPVNTFEIYIFPDDVDMIYPAEGTVVSSKTVKLIWNGTTPKAEAYWIEVAKSFFFGDDDIVARDSAVKDTFFTVNNLEYDQNYYWRVRAKNDAFWGDFDSEWEFLVAQLPDKPAQLYPADKFTTVAGIVKCGWAIGDIFAEYFRFELSTDPTMKTLVASDSTISDTFYVCGATKKLDPATYYWRVQSKNIAGWSEFSPIREFTVAASGVEENERFIAALSASASPLPATGAASVRFTLPAGGDVSVSLLDALGREVRAVASGYRAAGFHALDLALASLESGLYYCRIRTADGTGAIPVMIAR